jgi:hypothetical protein
MNPAMALRTHPDNPPVPSRACASCGGRGWLWHWDFDGVKVKTACPACSQPNPEQARMARAYGTDAQRREIADRTKGAPR